MLRKSTKRQQSYIIHTILLDALALFRVIMTNMQENSKCIGYIGVNGHN